MIAEKPTFRTQRNQSSELYETLLSARVPDERLLWWACPNVRRVQKRLWGMFAFALSWIAGSILVFSMAAKELTWGIVALFLFLVGGGILSAVINDYRRAARTVYGITDRRILTVTVDSKGGASVEYCVPNSDALFKCVILSDGSGDLTYAQRGVKDNEGSTHTESSKLIGIPDVRAVEQLLWKTFLW